MSTPIAKEIDMEVLIDGISASVDTEGVNTLQDLLKHLEKNHVEKSRVITRIFVNDEALDEGQEVGLGAFPIKDILSLSIETCNTVQLAGDALDDALEYLPTLSVVLENSARKIREGNVREGLQNISEALEVVGAFGEVLDGIRGAFRIDYAKVKIDDFSLLDKLNELGAQAQQILKAAKDEDWTMLADLVEYELAPLLYEWIAILPELISLLPENEE